MSSDLEKLKIDVMYRKLADSFRALADELDNMRNNPGRGGEQLRKLAAISQAVGVEVDNLLKEKGY